MAHRLPIGTALALAFLAGAARAQTPLTPEFRVNQYTTGYQTVPAVAADAAGNFLVVWASFDQNSNVLGRLYDANGTPKGSEFQLNEDSPFGQYEPYATFDAAGNFVVVWGSFKQNGSTVGVFGRRFGPTGAPLTGEFQVNTYTFNYQGHPRVAAGTNGEFVVVWEGFSQDGSESGIFGQRFNGSGAKLGPEFQVNTYTTSYQQFPAVASDAHGNFVVAWESYGQDTGTGYGVHAQRFDAAGNRLGAEFRVHAATRGSLPDVAMEPGGAFTVSWTASDGDIGGIWARRFNAQGAPLAVDFLVNSRTAANQAFSVVALDANANLAAAWVTALHDGDDFGIAARQLDCDGQALAGDFVVNSYTTGYQGRPRIAAAAGNFVVTWQSRGQNGSGDGVYARLYRGLPACGRLHTVAPCRLADTRDPPGPTGGPPLGANTTRTFPVGGACGIPADARAVALNITSVNPTDLGNLRAYPAGEPLPLASAINFVANHTRANNATVRLGTGGAVSVRCDMPAGSAGSTNLVLDVYGYFR